MDKDQEKTYGFANNNGSRIILRYTFKIKFILRSNLIWRQNKTQETNQIQIQF